MRGVGFRGRVYKVLNTSRSPSSNGWNGPAADIYMHRLNGCFRLIAARPSDGIDYRCVRQSFQRHTSEIPLYIPKLPLDPQEALTSLELAAIATGTRHSDFSEVKDDIDGASGNGSREPIGRCSEFANVKVHQLMRQCDGGLTFVLA